MSQLFLFTIMLFPKLLFFSCADLFPLFKAGIIVKGTRTPPFRKIRPVFLSIRIFPERTRGFCSPEFLPLPSIVALFRSCVRLSPGLRIIIILSYILTALTVRIFPDSLSFPESRSSFPECLSIFSRITPFTVKTFFSKTPPFPPFTVLTFSPFIIEVSVVAFLTKITTSRFSTSTVFFSIIISFHSSILITLRYMHHSHPHGILSLYFCHFLF